MIRWKHAAILLFALLVFSPVVPAQEPTAQEPTAGKVEEIDILSVSPDDLVGVDVSALVSKAHLAYNEKRYEDAARSYVRALRRNPGDSTALYNLACCYGLLGAGEQAADFLLAAYAAGFRDLSHIRRDPDFDPVRESDRFKQLLEDLGERAEKERAARGDAVFVAATRLVPVRVVTPDDMKPFERLPLVIGLHGLGDDAENFVRLFARRGITGRFLFAVPDAPHPMPAGSRGVGYSWYFRSPEGGTADGIRSHALNVKFVLDVLDAVKKHYRVDERKVFLMGFSQGAGMTLSVGLARPDLFRGLIPIGGWAQPGEHSEAALLAVAEEATRVLICHSPEDRVVPFEGAEKAAELLTNAGIRNRLVEYDGGHTVSKAVLSEIVTWIEGE